MQFKIIQLGVNQASNLQAKKANRFSVRIGGKSDNFAEISKRETDNFRA